MINAIVYILSLIFLLAIAVRMRSRDIIGYSVLLWALLSVIAFFEIGLFGVIQSIGVFLLSVIIPYFVIRYIVVKRQKATSNDLKEYLVKTSLIVGYVIFWTLVLIFSGFTISNILGMTVTLLLLGGFYVIIALIAGGIIYTVTGIILRLIPPTIGRSKEIVHYDEPPIPPVATRAFRTKRDGKDITHVLVRIDNDATNSKN